MFRLRRFLFWDWPFFWTGSPAFFERAAPLSPPRTVFLACFVFWNAGLMFQWGTHLIPARGPISFSEMIQNQFLVVPRQISMQFEKYLFGRKAMMQQIEQRDLEQLKENPPPP